MQQQRDGRIGTIQTAALYTMAWAQDDENLAPATSRSSLGNKRPHCWGCTNTNLLLLPLFLWCLWKFQFCHLKTKVLSWQERLHKAGNGSCHICTVWTPSVSQVYSERKQIPSSSLAIYQ